MLPCKGLSTLTCDDIGHITTHIMMEQANITGVQEQPTESSQTHTSHLSADHAAAETQYVCFMLTGGEYGVEISCVLQILKPTMEPTPVPQSPFFVEGVIDLRGDIIPIIDLKKRFGLKPIDDTPPSRILVIQMADILVGFLVDSVTEVLRVQKRSIQDAPGKIVGIDKEYIWGVTKRSAESHLIMLLDVERILRVDDEEMSGDAIAMT